MALRIELFMWKRQSRLSMTSTGTAHRYCTLKTYMKLQESPLRNEQYHTPDEGELKKTNKHEDECLLK